MADFKEFITVELNSETGKYCCYWEKQDLADGINVDCDWWLNVSLSNAIDFLRDYNYDTDEAIRKLVTNNKYYKEDEY